WLTPSRFPDARHRTDPSNGESHDAWPETTPGQARSRGSPAQRCPAQARNGLSTDQGRREPDERQQAKARRPERQPWRPYRLRAETDENEEADHAVRLAATPTPSVPPPRRALS